MWYIVPEISEFCFPYSRSKSVIYTLKAEFGCKSVANLEPIIIVSHAFGCNYVRDLKISQKTARQKSAKKTSELRESPTLPADDGENTLIMLDYLDFAHAIPSPISIEKPRFFSRKNAIPPKIFSLRFPLKA
jgi:hypothetical protein